MSESLPPFSGDDPRCPKCGNRGAATVYVDGGHCHDHRARLSDVADERLCRRCLRCDYSWDEAIVSGDSPAIPGGAFERAQIIKHLHAASINTPALDVSRELERLVGEIARGEHLKANADV